jgi:hypothetical protein
VRKIPTQIFESLLQEPLTPEHKKLIKSFSEAQSKFGLLTKRKYAYFWTIHNKYLPIHELEYSDTVKIPIVGHCAVNATKHQYVDRKKKKCH